MIGPKSFRLWTTWRNFVWSRTVENLAVVVTTSEPLFVFGPGPGHGCDPEEVVFETTAAGVFVVDVDIDRVRQLGAEMDVIAPPKGTVRRPCSVLRPG